MDYALFPMKYDCVVTKKKNSFRQALFRRFYKVFLLSPLLFERNFPSVLSVYVKIFFV